MQLIIYFLLLLPYVLSAKILGVFTIPSYSHQITYRALWSELAKNGHELVIITTDPDPANYTNVKQIDVGSISYDIVKEKFLKHLDPTNFDVSLQLGKIFADVTDAQLRVQDVKELLYSNRKFDLIILEVIDRGSFVYADVFSAPVVGISSLSIYDFTFEVMGAPIHPLLYENLWDYHLNDGHLWNKCNLVWAYIRRQYEEYVLTQIYNEIFKSHLGSQANTLPTLVQKLDLVLMNTNPVWHGARPLPPGVIMVGGLHLKPQKPLPEDLKAMLDSATNGVVYMSLGSNVKSKNLPIEKIKAISDAFRELPYLFLWKSEDEFLDDKSDNIIIRSWFPQGDMLGHPNIKAFITQGGQQSTDEAIRGHVPAIVVPFLGDQAINAEKFVLHNIGKRLNVQELTKDSFKDAILELVANKSYHKNIANLHSVMAHHEVEPVKKAVWWCEYVLQHGGGGKHLRGPVLPFYEYYMLDLIFYGILFIYSVYKVLSVLIVKYFVKINLSKYNRKYD